MKKLPILINMARGEIVNTDDLLIALKNGDLRGAALDVTNPEPISGYHELCSLKNCIIVPHIGTATSECRIDMARIAVNLLIRNKRIARPKSIIIIPKNMA